MYSKVTKKVETLVASTEDIEGLAWDDTDQKLYYTSENKIYRATGDGNSVQVVFNSTDCEYFPFKFYENLCLICYIPSLPSYFLQLGLISLLLQMKTSTPWDWIG